MPLLYSPFLRPPPSSKGLKGSEETQDLRPKYLRPKWSRVRVPGLTRPPACT